MLLIPALGGGWDEHEYPCETDGEPRHEWTWP